MQTNDVETAERIAALENAVPALHWLEQLLANEKASQVKALENFAGDKRLLELGKLFEEQRSEFDALDFVGRLRFGSGRGLWSDEEFHSNCIAWLLDPQGSRGMGDAILKSFLEQAGTADELLAADWSQADVIREWENLVGDQWGYLDILIVNQSDRVLCAIENKVFSSEHSEQLTRYRKALADLYPDFTRHHVFLTPRGTPPYRKEERASWMPVSYATVLNIVQQIVDDNSSPVREDVRSFLRQYATTLRRNIVPETSVQQQARAVYLEHREAIELIYENKPDYRGELKLLLKDAIGQQHTLILDREDSDYIRFRPRDWDKYEAQKTGTLWSDVNRLLLFAFYCPQDPVGAGGPCLALYPGTDEDVRRRLYEAARQNWPIFKPRESSLQSGVTHLQEYKWNILDEADFRNWDDPSVRSKVENLVSSFVLNEFPAMNEVIVNCLREYEAEQGAQ